MPSGPAALKSENVSGSPLLAEYRMQRPRALISSRSGSSARRNWGRCATRAFLLYDSRRFVRNIGAWRTEMAKKTTKLRPWTKEDIRTLKTLAREKVKTSVIARKLKRTLGSTYQKAMKLGVTLGARRKKRKA